MGDGVAAAVPVSELVPEEVGVAVGELVGVADELSLRVGVTEGDSPSDTEAVGDRDFDALGVCGGVVVGDAVNEGLAVGVTVAEGVADKVLVVDAVPELDGVTDALTPFVVDGV